ncbi:hypothetical protein ACVILK_005419 [Bradyrhizobium embrapense]
MPWIFLAAASKEPVFIPATAWSLLADYRFVRGWGERTGSTGPIWISPGIQLAQDPKKPGEGWEAEYPWKTDGVYGSPDGWRELGEPEFKTVYVRAGWIVRLPKAGKSQHVAATGVIELSAGK